MKETKMFAFTIATFVFGSLLETIYFQDGLAALFLASLAFISLLIYTALNLIYRWLHETG